MVELCDKRAAALRSRTGSAGAAHKFGDPTLDKLSEVFSKLAFSSGKFMFKDAFISNRQLTMRMDSESRSSVSQPARDGNACSHGRGRRLRGASGARRPAAAGNDGVSQNRFFTNSWRPHG
jgi:hypothetical protein